jgi:hypothetical protein
MTGVLGDVGQVVSLALLVLGVVAAVLLLWRPSPSMRPRSRAPWLSLAGGAAIVLGRGSVSGHGWPDRGTVASAGRRPDQKGFP